MVTTMTNLDFANCIESTRNKLVGMLVKEFRRVPVEDAEDIAHAVILRYARKLDEFNSVSGMLAYAYEVSKLWMIEGLEQKLSRRRALKGLPRLRVGRDPMRHVDYQIDLQRSIMKATSGPLRNACWLVIYEGWERDEVTPLLGSERAMRTWRNKLDIATRNVRKEMHKKGYK